MAIKKNNLGIFLLIGTVVLFSSFKNKNKSKAQNSLIDMSGLPTGTNSIYLIPKAIIYNESMAPIYINNSGSYLQVAVLNDPSAPNGMFNVAYGMDFLNAQTGYVTFESTIVNP
jgi:hypothetical protein